MDSFRNAAKALIVHEGRLLLIKRRPNDPHKPGEWDIPGGRLELGENSYEGLKRECLEETGIDIDIVMPIDVCHFSRDDGQQIALMIFLCRPKSTDIKLSEEHTEYKWLELTQSISEFPEWLQEPINRAISYNICK